MMVDNSIHVVPYDATWPQQFEDERAAILENIGQYDMQIEHIGSTSVTGLGAKPVIDIMIGLRQYEDNQHCIPVLESMGYQYVPEFETVFPNRRFFRKRNQAGNRTYHIHMVEIGCAFWKDHLLFRDYLREHPDEANAYYRLKVKLAGDYPTNISDYTDAKTEFIQEVMARARQWQIQTP